MRFKFCNLCAVWNGEVIFKNHSNAPLHVYISDKEHVIESHESMSVELDQKYARVTLVTEQSHYICKNYVVKRGSVYTIRQDDCDVANRIS